MLADGFVEGLCKRRAERKIKIICARSCNPPPSPPCVNGGSKMHRFLAICILAKAASALTSMHETGDTFAEASGIHHF